MAEPMKIQKPKATRQRQSVDESPMETGQRKDAKTGQVVPAHFIQTVTAQVNGKTVLDAQWSQAISKNPFLGFKVKGAKAGDKVLVSWVDNKGDKNHAEAVVA